MKRKRVHLDIPIAEAPLDTIGIDTYGQFSRVRKQVHCTVIDHFSSWTEVVAVPDK